MAFRVQDILTATTWLRNRRDTTGTVDLVGLEDAGLWCMFASALDDQIGKTWVDTNQFDAEDDAAWVDKYYAPGIRSVGDVTTAAALIAPRPLFVDNTGTQFSTKGIAEMYKAADAKTLKVSAKAAQPSQIAKALR